MYALTGNALKRGRGGGEARDAGTTRERALTAARCRGGRLENGIVAGGRRRRSSHCRTGTGRLTGTASGMPWQPQAEDSQLALALAGQAHWQEAGMTVALPVAVLAPLSPSQASTTY